MALGRERYDYDVVVVGARVAGAATALLLARAGLDVLVLDRSEPGADTLSTHALTRGGVVQLRRWGVLDELAACGTPAIQRSTFHYFDEHVELDMEARDGVDALYAPRRTVLDPLLVKAATHAGAEIRHGVRVTGLERDDVWGVVGVRLSDEAGRERSIHARLTIGADGRHSLVAREVVAPTTWRGRHAGAMLYGHFPDPGVSGYHWFYSGGATAGIIPTNDGLVCAWVGAPADRFMAELRGDPGRAFSLLLAEAAPEYLEAFPPSAAADRLFGYGGSEGYLRKPFGRGWALVGDAGYFKDPLTAHGITDALRDAELLARAVTAGSISGEGDCVHEGYELRRDELSGSFASVTDRIASYDWDREGIKVLVREEGRLLAEEARLLAALE